MSITMRIIQEFDAAHEQQFMELEQKFVELETRRPDYPKAKRMQPIAAGIPCNTLVWQCEFPTIQAARDTLDFFRGDAEHEALFEKQEPYFERVHIEFYQNLDF